MKYIVTYSTSQSIPYYWKQDTSCKAKHSNLESYEVEDLDACRAIVNDLMDVPVAELSLEQVKKDCGKSEPNLSEEKAIKIQNYYNGRLALYNVIMKELDSQSSWQLLKHEIPAEYASFCIDVDGTENLMTKITIQKC